MASQQFEPPSGTRDFLAGDLRVREHVFAAVRDVFERYGFEPLQTPAFERLDRRGRPGAALRHDGPAGPGGGGVRLPVAGALQALRDGAGLAR